MIRVILLTVALLFGVACDHDDSDDGACISNLPDQASEAGCEHSNR